MVHVVFKRRKTLYLITETLPRDGCVTPSYNGLISIKIRFGVRGGGHRDGGSDGAEAVRAVARGDRGTAASGGELALAVVAVAHNRG
jgi:hypothetical protein